MQKMGAQGIVGAFRAAITSVAEAEAHIKSVQTRLRKKASKNPQVELPI